MGDILSRCRTTADTDSQEEEGRNSRDFDPLRASQGLPSADDNEATPSTSHHPSVRRGDTDKGVYIECLVLGLTSIRINEHILTHSFGTLCSLICTTVILSQILCQLIAPAKKMHCSCKLNLSQRRSMSSSKISYTQSTLSQCSQK